MTASKPIYVLGTGLSRHDDGCGNALDDCMDLEGAQLFETPDAQVAHLWHEKDSFHAIDGNRLNPLVKDFSPRGHGNKKYPPRGA